MWFRILLALACSAVTAHAEDWIATLSFGTVQFRLALHLASAGGAWRARLDSIDQDSFGLAVTGLHRSSKRLRFRVPHLNARFEGDFSGGDKIEGAWTQRGGRLPLHFIRGNIRPQEPLRPFPYNSHNVVFLNGKVRLAGTLTVPRSPGPHPAVILITGSGAQDRNDTGAGHRPFLVWADYLTRRGFAVLRMDDRGVGGSSGRVLDATDDDFAGDVLAGVAYLKIRKDIDRGRIGLLGHSEGGTVAPLAARRSRDIAFAVLLGAPALPGEQILAAQSERIDRAMGMPEDVALKKHEVERKLIAIAHEPGDPAARRRKMEAVFGEETAWVTPEQAAVLRVQVGQQIGVAASRWFSYVLGYDPRPALEALACPALAVYGTLDLQVPPELNAPAMEAALRHSGQRVVVLPNLNHMLQPAVTGSPTEYPRIEQTVADEVLQLVVDWLGQFVAAPK